MPVYQLRVEYERPETEGAVVKDAAPSFPYMEGWTFAGIDLDGQQIYLTYEGSGEVPKAMETLFTFLDGAAKRGEIAGNYDVKLFVDEASEPPASSPAASEPPAAVPVAAGPTGPTSSKTKKGKWMGLF